MQLPVYSDPNARRAFAMHDRSWQQNLYVYAVVSRRSKGISIGVNLNPDKVCNFDCIYCSVNRKVESATRAVDLVGLRVELEHMVGLCRSGAIYHFDPFDRIPAELRRINDIAFSGDGEPTTCPQFVEVCRMAAEVKERAGLAEVKLVLISNATMFHRPYVREGLAILDRHNGEIWGKLDAGTEAYYRLVDRTSVPLRRVLENLTWAAQVRPIVIQSLFMKVHGVGPTSEEIAAYVGRLADLVAAGGKIKLVQAYTVARTPAESYATPLSAQELEGIAGAIRERLPGLVVEVYP